MPTELTPRDHELLNGLLRAVEDLMLRADEPTVRRIAEHVTEHGTDGDGGSVVDVVVADCLQVMADNMGMLVVG